MKDKSLTSKLRIPIYPNVRRHLGGILLLLCIAQAVAPTEIVKKMQTDYKASCLVAPPDTMLIQPEKTTNFTASDFIQQSAYAPYVIDQGFIIMTQAIRTRANIPVLLSSGFRDPATNRAKNGALLSIHQGGGAADLVPARRSTATMLSIYIAGLDENPGLVLLERAEAKRVLQLLPGNWRPPITETAVTFGVMKGTLKDQNNDGLVDHVKFEAPSLPFMGSELPFAQLDRVKLRVKGTGDLLPLEVQFGSIPWKSLKDLIDHATHVHAQNDVKVEAIKDCSPKNQ